MARVTAGWARHGKAPRSFQDYAVLECGGAFSAADYAAILDRYALGNPPPEKTGDEALPWITLSEVQDDDHSYLGVSVLNWTGESDGAGRPIAETRYGCFPFPQFSRAPVSYRELATAVDRLGPDGFGPDGADVAAYAPEEHERDLMRDGWYQRAMVAAAMLLEGPVTITGAGGLDVDERLRFLDAVAALLPFGWRTRFTASTWFRGGSPYIQLAFARHSRGNGFHLDWRAEPVQGPPPGADIAGPYLKELGELVERRGFGLLEVLAFLGTQTESLAEAEPRRAVEILEWFDWPGSVLQRVRDGVAEPEELRTLFDSGRYEELPRKQDHVFLLCELMRLGGPDFAPAIEKVYRPVNASASQEGRTQIWTTLRDSARALLWNSTPDRRVDAYVGMAHRLGLADDLLARLLPQNGAPGLEVDDSRVAAAAWLVARWVDPAGPEPWPRTLAALRTNPLIVCALIIAQNADADARPRLRAWLARLEKTVPGELLRPFQILLNAPARPLGADDLAGVARHGEGCVSALLWLATDLGRVDRVIPPFLDWLVARPEAVRLAWADRLATLAPTRGEDRAVLDVLLLRSGARPAHLAAAVGPGWDAYLRAFRRHAGEAWMRPALPNARAGMVDHLVRSNWAADEEQVRAVVQVAEALCDVPGQDWSELARAVVRGRAIKPQMVESPEYRRWWRKIAAAYPRVVEEQYMTSLTALPRGARAEEIGRLAAESMRQGTPARQVLAWIAKSEARPTGEVMLEVVIETRRALVQLGASRTQAGDKAVEMAKALAQGYEYGVANGFRNAVAAQAEEELWFQLMLVEVTSSIPPDYTEREVTGRARDALNEAAGWIRDLLGKRGFLRR
ncbi:hypothetical protein [Actinomadura rugatobispora]|uniref:HEAT repeat domain-containing protein n=1 Tax=Actinomadura rugatobispora TaxID=1994 RepID=A0ABW1A161_9ACTN|nr:hypothetical protein GCM10010200_049650 [Actinomadura rugatobispora]